MIADFYLLVLLFLFPPRGLMKLLWTIEGKMVWSEKCIKGPMKVYCMSRPSAMHMPSRYNFGYPVHKYRSVVFQGEKRCCWKKVSWWAIWVMSLSYPSSANGVISRAVLTVEQCPWPWTPGAQCPVKFCPVCTSEIKFKKWLWEPRLLINLKNEA